HRKTLGQHPLLEKRASPTGLRYRRPRHPSQRNPHHPDNNRRRQTHLGLLPRALQGRCPRHRHSISNSPRRQSPHPHHHDRHAHERRVRAGVGSARKGGEEDGDSGIGIFGVSFRPIHHLPTHNRSHNFPRKLPAIKRSIPRQRPRLGSLKRPPLLRIEDSNI